MKKTKLLAAAVMLAASGGAMAEVDFGADLRVRYTELGDIITRAGFAFDQGFSRIRPRVWADYKPAEDITLHARLTNEFRYYNDAKFPPASDQWDPLSEVVVDHLYADFINLMDGKMSLRVGRQDLIYGTGKIILDGTPLDGSRTIYFNAIKAGLELPADNHVDLLAIFNQAEDDLVINPQGPDNTALLTTEQDETAFGFYAKNSHYADLPFEYYYIYKEEDSRGDARPDVDFHTAGLRLAPKLGDGLKGNFEGAYQVGDHGNADISAFLLDGSVSYAFAPEHPLKPSLTAGWYHLSGDDPGSSDHEGWHQVFARWPQISELYIYTYVGTDYSIAGWSNVSTPYIGLNVTPAEGASFALRYYKLYADEADGAGSGDERGDLLTANLKFSVSKNLSGHLLAELFSPGDYYPSGTDDGQFLRLNFEYKF